MSALRATPGAPHDGALVEIRLAAREDLPTVNVLERACFADPWPASAFVEAIESPHVYFTVAVTPPQTVVGYLVGWFVGGDGEIANIAVAAGARGHGIGGRLLDDALDTARTAGAETVHLEVRESNAAAQALYASRSFVAVGRRRGYYRRPPEDAIVLRRTIGPG